VARGIPSEVIKHFHLVPLFRSVSKKGIRSIVQAATEVDVREDTVLVREGRTDRDLFVILRGTANVVKDGKRVRELVPGDFFGELALLHGAPRSATVTARTDMRLMVLGWREMSIVLEHEPTIAKQLLAAMAERVRANERSVTN
jgi:CRP-like cAMP-binding protein